MFDPIANAIRWADRPEHDGAGYSLVIRFANASSLRAEVYKDDDDAGYRLVGSIGDDQQGEELFVNPAHVSLVTVDWG